MAIAKKKKRFFDVEMPLIRKTTQLQALDIKELEGRYIKYDLTRIMKGKSIMLQLKVKIDEDKATSTPIELKLMPFYLRRMVRKGTDYVEESFSTDCVDSQLRVKPLLITRRRVSRAVKNALREKAKEELIKYIASRKTADIFDEILQNRLQKELSLKLKKVYPLSLCEIRILKVEKQKEEPSASSPKSQTKELEPKKKESPKKTKKKEEKKASEEVKETKKE